MYQYEAKWYIIVHFISAMAAVENTSIKKEITWYEDTGCQQKLLTQVVDRNS